MVPAGERAVQVDRVVFPVRAGIRLETGIPARLDGWGGIGGAGPVRAGRAAPSAIPACPGAPPRLELLRLRLCAGPSGSSSPGSRRAAPARAAPGPPV